MEFGFLVSTIADIMPLTSEKGCWSKQTHLISEIKVKTLQSSKSQSSDLWKPIMLVAAASVETSWWPWPCPLQDYHSVDAAQVASLYHYGRVAQVTAYALQHRNGEQPGNFKRPGEAAGGYRSSLPFYPAKEQRSQRIRGKKWGAGGSKEEKWEKSIKRRLKEESKESCKEGKRREGLYSPAQAKWPDGWIRNPERKGRHWVNHKSQHCGGL